jgi:hypothetical protein
MGQKLRDIGTIVGILLSAGMIVTFFYTRSDVLAAKWNKKADVEYVDDQDAVIKEMIIQNEEIHDKEDEAHQAQHSVEYKALEKTMEVYHQTVLEIVNSK